MRLLLVATIADTLKAFLLPYAEHFRARGWRVDAMAAGAHDSAECRASFDRAWDAPWTRRPVRWENARAARQVREQVRDGSYDIVHVHTPVAAFVTRWALRALSSRPVVIYTAHGFHFFRGGGPLRNSAFLALEKLAARWTDYLVVMNGEDHDAATRHHFLPHGRVFLMPGIGVPLQRLQADAIGEDRVTRVRQQLGLVGAETVFVMVGEFIPRKRQHDAVRAFKLFGDAKARLVFAGAGPLLDKERRRASGLGLEHQVRFPGLVHDVPALLRLATAVLLPSSQEGLPRCVMEAMAVGTPVIGSDARGTRDLLRPIGALTHPVGDYDALARAMRWVVDHPEDANSVARKGREVIASYSTEQVLRLHEDLYREALMSRGRMAAT